MVTRLTTRNEKQANEPGLTPEDSSLLGGGDARPSSVVPAVSGSVSRQNSPQAPPISDEEPVVGEGSVGSKESVPLIPSQVEPPTDPEQDLSGESETRVPLQANSQVSIESENQQTDNATHVEEGQTSVQPNQEDSTNSPKRKTSLVVETARLLQNAECIAQRQQRDESLRTKILASGSVKDDYVLDDGNVLHYAPRGEKPTLAIPRTMVARVLSLVHSTNGSSWNSCYHSHHQEQIQLALDEKRHSRVCEDLWM